MCENLIICSSSTNTFDCLIHLFNSKFDPWDEAYLWPEPDASEGADHQDHDGVDTPIETNERNKKIVDMLNAIGIDKLSNVKVYHCYQAFGVRIWSREGWSVVYSGDTRPCPELEELGRGATILIHEVGTYSGQFRMFVCAVDIKASC